MKLLLEKLLHPKIECKYESVLRPLRLFHSLTRRELGLVELILHNRTYLKDEIIFEEGEQGLGMYIILEGAVKVVRSGESGKREIATLGPGENFGEMALLGSNNSRSATVIATSPTKILSLFQPEFLQLLESHERIGFKVCYELACGLADRLTNILERGSLSETV